MRKILICLFNKFGTMMISLAVLTAPLASEICRNRYYQPEEPEGFDKFVKANKHK